ncbi:MAG: hypothetical protein ACREKH_10910, partial [Candidatus Rokuibacteriota bacterium]
VQSGRGEEFDALDRLLRRIWSHLGDLGSTPVLLAVPGNHDLWRPPASGPGVGAIRDWTTQRSVPGEFWENAAGVERVLVADTFGDYQSWWTATRLRPTVQHGLLPGDFSYTSEKHGRRLGIIGLNSSAFQLQAGPFEGKLGLHAAQFHAVAGEGGGPAWARGHEACLLLTHQPPSWLMPEALAHLRGEIAIPGRFAAHLFGHMHEPQLTALAEGGAPPRTHWQATSLFGIETFTTNAGEQSRRHGYAAGRLEVRDDGTAALTFWPREARRAQAGHLQLVPDASYVLADDGRTIPLIAPLAYSPAAPPAAPATRPDRATAEVRVDRRSKIRDVGIEASEGNVSVTVDDGSAARDIDIVIKKR